MCRGNTTRFLDEDRARSQIPVRLLTQNERCIPFSCRHEGHPQQGGVGLRPGDGNGRPRLRPAWVLQHCLRRNQAATCLGGALTDPDGGAVQKRPLPAMRLVEFVQFRRIQHPAHRDALFHNGKPDAPMRITANIGAGAVNRVHDPAAILLARMGIVERLFGQPTIFRTEACQSIRAELVHGHIGFGHRTAAALVPGLCRLAAEHEGLRQFPGFLRELTQDFHVFKQGAVSYPQDSYPR